MPPNRDPYDYLDARDIALMELDAHPKDATHPFRGLPTPHGQQADPLQQAIRIREEYVERRVKGLGPRKPLPEKAVERIIHRRKEPIIKDAYRAKVCADHFAARGFTQDADVLYAQEDAFLKAAEKVV